MQFWHKLELSQSCRCMGLILIFPLLLHPNAQIVTFSLWIPCHLPALPSPCHVSVVPLRPAWSDSWLLCQPHFVPLSNIFTGFQSTGSPKCTRRFPTSGPLHMLSLTPWNTSSSSVHQGNSHSCFDFSFSDPPSPLNNTFPTPRNLLQLAIIYLFV